MNSECGNIMRINNIPEETCNVRVLTTVLLWRIISSSTLFIDNWFSNLLPLNPLVIKKVSSASGLKQQPMSTTIITGHSLWKGIIGKASSILSLTRLDSSPQMILCPFLHQLFTCTESTALIYILGTFPYVLSFPMACAMYMPTTITLVANISSLFTETPKLVILEDNMNRLSQLPCAY